MIDQLSNDLEKYMDVVSARQKLVTSNIANADTPGYKTLDLNFQDSLNALLGGAPTQPVEVAGLTTKNDGNNVDLDREARLLAENSLRFSIASNLMHGEIQQIKAAISGGKS